jgi:hypothetical protein
VSDGLLPIGLFSRASRLPVREIYLVSYDETDETERFRTEIHWPIAP